MSDARYTITVQAEDQATAGRAATALADSLRQVDGVLDADRGKPTGAQSMDLGSVVTVVATSGAAVSIAQGIAAWLRARRGATVTVERDLKSGSLKASVEGIDPQVALRIVELVREG